MNVYCQNISGLYIEFLGAQLQFFNLNANKKQISFWDLYYTGFLFFELKQTVVYLIYVTQWIILNCLFFLLIRSELLITATFCWLLECVRLWYGLFYQVQVHRLLFAMFGELEFTSEQFWPIELFVWSLLDDPITSERTFFIAETWWLIVFVVRKDDTSLTHISLFKIGTFETKLLR